MYLYLMFDAISARSYLAVGLFMLLYTVHVFLMLAVDQACIAGGIELSCVVVVCMLPEC